MNPFKLLAETASWLLNRIAGPVDLGAVVNANRSASHRTWSGGVWPDGEQPLLDGDLADRIVYGVANTEDIMELIARSAEIWATVPQQSSALSGSTASEAGVDSEAEGPTPGAAQTPGVGHLSSPEPLVEVDGVVPSFAVGSGRPNITAALLISAAIGLREYAASADCEAPTYWKAIADQLDPK